MTVIPKSSFLEMQNVTKGAKADLKTVVLLCADLATLGQGIDLEEVRKWLQDSVPAVQVYFVRDLGHRLGELTETLSGGGAARLVLGLGPEEFARGEMQVRVRKAGLDPTGVEVVNLGAYAALMHPRSRATERAKILLAAAVARARAFPGGQPESTKPHLPRGVSRRSLFSLSLLEHLPVPFIQVDRCTASSGCELCAQACPPKAMERASGQIKLDKSLCESCGLCMTACPREAICFPGYAPTQLAAQITTLLDSEMGALQPRGLLFLCQRSARIQTKLAKKAFSDPHARSQVLGSRAESGALGIELFPVEVPCLGMLQPTWLLGSLTVGASVVLLAPCPGQCPFDQKEVIKGRVAYCQELLGLLGESAKRTRVVLVPEGAIPLSTLQIVTEDETCILECPNGNPFSSQVVPQLAKGCQAPMNTLLAHPHSPFGVIDVADGCTGCGVCASTCPTGALSSERENGSVALTFDAALCTACAQCLPKCPEAAKEVLHLQRVTDLQRISQGRTVLFRDQARRCKACGAPMAPEAMLSRIGTTLGDEFASTLSLIANYCPECRGWSS